MVDKIKDNLLTDISTAIKQLQVQSCDNETSTGFNFTDQMWQVQELCHRLDCSLTHGLKSAAKGYWTFVQELTHRSTIQQIYQFPRAVSNVTRGWAWLYIALNDRAMESYLMAIMEQPKLTKKHYLPHALLRDTQRLQALITINAGLEYLSFSLNPEMADLASWKSTIDCSKKSNEIETDSAEEAESISLASYESCGADDQSDLGNDSLYDDPELGIVSIVTFDPVSGLPQEDIVHSSVRAVRRRKKEKSIKEVDQTPENSWPKVAPDYLESQSSNLQLTNEEIQIQRESLLNFILKSDIDFTIDDQQSNVILRSKSENDRKSLGIKRVSFDTDNLVSVWDIDQRPSITEREGPEGQEDPVMITSITSLKLTNPTEDELKSKSKSGSGSGSKSWHGLINGVNVEVIESASKQLQDEIETEIREAKLSVMNTSTLLDGEIPLENNFLLMIMLEVIDDQDEKVYKVFTVTVGHTEGSPLDSLVVLTDRRFYLTHVDPKNNNYVVDASVSFVDIEFLQLSINYQIINLVCAKPRRRYWMCTGNEQVTRNIVSSLEVSIRRCPQVSSLPCVFTDSTAQSIAIEKWISTTCDVNSVTIDHYSLVTWEDPHAASSTPNANPGGPFKKGNLMYRYTCDPEVGQWNPGYFLLKAGVCYLFEEPSDRIFKSYIQLFGGLCIGCRRIHFTDRPHAFELILIGDRSLQLAAPSDIEASEWLQVFLQAVSQGCDDLVATSSPCVLASLIQASQMLFICHEVLETNCIKCLAKATIEDVSNLYIADDDPYCILEFESVDAMESNGDWVLYFTDTIEMNKFLKCLSSAWQNLYQVPLPKSPINDPTLQKHCLQWGKKTVTQQLGGTTETLRNNI